MSVEIRCFFMPFHWKDLAKVQFAPHSRYNEAVLMLLAGYRVDLSQVPRRAGFRSPSKVRRHLRAMLSRHEGVSREGDVFWIEERVKLISDIQNNGKRA